jgi:hypothetical protein
MRIGRAHWQTTYGIVELAVDDDRVFTPHFVSIAYFSLV